MMTKSLALGYLPSSSFQFLYQDLLKRFRELPLRWEAPHRLKGFFFPFRQQRAVQELINQIQSSYPEDMFPLNVEFTQLQFAPSVYAPKSLCVRAELPLRFQKYLKELSRLLKRSSCLDTPYLDLQLGRVDRGKLQLKHIEALNQSIQWKDSLNQLVLFEKKKNGTELFYEFQELQNNKKKAFYPPRSFLRAPQ